MYLCAKVGAEVKMRKGEYKLYPYLIPRYYRIKEKIEPNKS